jgi:hypothetical protein
MSGSSVILPAPCQRPCYNHGCVQSSMISGRTLHNVMEGCCTGRVVCETYRQHGTGSLITIGPRRACMTNTLTFLGFVSSDLNTSANLATGRNDPWRVFPRNKAAVPGSRNVPTNCLGGTFVGCAHVIEILSHDEGHQG